MSELPALGPCRVPRRPLKRTIGLRTETVASYQVCASMPWSPCFPHRTFPSPSSTARVPMVAPRMWYLNWTCVTREKRSSPYSMTWVLEYR